MFDITVECDNYFEQMHMNNNANEFLKAIHDCICSQLCKIPENAAVVIRGGGNHTDYILKNLSETGRLKNVIAIVDDFYCGDTKEGIAILGKNDFTKLTYDTIIVSSFSYREEIKAELSSAEYITIVDIYDGLEEQGIVLESPYYFYVRGGYEIPLYYTHKYNASKEKCDLENVIGTLYEIKDFSSLYAYIDEYIKNGFDDNGHYGMLKCNLEDLFSRIKQKLKMRKKKDILAFWVDAVDSKNLDWLPYIHSRKEVSCFFEHAYTNTSYTHPTMRSLLDSALPIDNYEKSSKQLDNNSKVIAYLNDHNYSFKHIGFSGVGHIDTNYNVSQSRDGICFNSHVAGSIVLWETLRELILSEKPVFFMIHTFVETHFPSISLNLPKKHSYKEQAIKQTNQRQLSHKYIDGQIRYYNTLFGYDITKIYMSDHGNRYDFMAWEFVEHRIRPFFMVEGRNIEPRVIRKIFSYMNFINIVKWLIEENDDYLQDALTEYSYVQDIDYYSQKNVLEAIRVGCKERAMSYRGIVTLRDKYVEVKNGMKLYFILPDEEHNRIDDEIYFDRIQELKGLLKREFLDISNDTKFKFSKMLYD